jgi:hypothetical protein
MGLKTTNILPGSTLVAEIDHLIRLLGYKENKNVKIKNVYLYSYASNNEKSSKIDLVIYKNPLNISINTSNDLYINYWHKKLQNIIPNILKNCFGGQVYIDKTDDKWLKLRPIDFENLQFRVMNQNKEFKFIISRIDFYKNTHKNELMDIDCYNPEKWSNHLALIYMGKVWEAYLKSLFKILLEYSLETQTMICEHIKAIDLSKEITNDKIFILETMANRLSFHDLKESEKHFKTIDSRLEILKLDNDHKKTLKNLMDTIIKMQRELSFSTTIDIYITDKYLEVGKEILMIASECIHEEISHYCKSTNLFRKNISKIKRKC